MFLDGSWRDLWLYATNEPPSVEGGGGVCINRHDGYVNAAFLDYSVRQVGLKELWQLKWHRAWIENYRAAGPPAAWNAPDHWMYNMKDYELIKMLD